MSELTASKRDRYAQLTLLAALALSSALVLRPFLPALLFSMVTVIATWPVHAWLLNKQPRRPRLVSAATCLLVTFVVLLPAALLMMSFADGLNWVLGLLAEWQKSGAPKLPDWIAGLPVAGEYVSAWWSGMTASEDWMQRFARQLAEPARALLLAGAQAAANGLLQVAIAAVLLFFFYLHGVTLAARAEAIAHRIAGSYGNHLLKRVRSIVWGVMLGVLGAALAQATIATFGFYIASVPNPFLLGALTFALSLVPVGPPLIWGGAAIWLFRQAEPAWGFFMLIYGVLGISAIDNVLKPFVISRSSRLPFAITLVGVIGGIIAFGVSGIFLGPILLALGVDVVQHWLEASKDNEPGKPEVSGPSSRS